MDNPSASLFSLVKKVKIKIVKFSCLIISVLLPLSALAALPLSVPQAESESVKDEVIPLSQTLSQIEPVKSEGINYLPAVKNGLNVEPGTWTITIYAPKNATYDEFPQLSGFLSISRPKPYSRELDRNISLADFQQLPEPVTILNEQMRAWHYKTQLLNKSDFYITPEISSSLPDTDLTLGLRQNCGYIKTKILSIFDKQCD